MEAEKPGQDRVHFISIGGAAMHSLALALHNEGWAVSGSDDQIREPSRSRLKKAGLLPEKMGWDPERITSDIQAVILGMHARSDNPELLKALQLGLNVYSFPEFLYERTRDKKRVVIGGSHGKTTVTSIIIHVLKHAGISFDFLVGAQIEGFDNMASLSQSSGLAVFEGDEYLSSALDPRPKFHLYRPHIAVITGIAWDHINVFPSYREYLEQFTEFIERIEPSGSLVYFTDDPEVRRIAGESRPDLRKIAYTAHPYVVKGGRFLLDRENNQALPILLFGKHNMQNIAAAACVCRSLGVSGECFYEAVRNFRGAARRLQVLAETESSTIYLDFAHAPSKVTATVKALRELRPKRRLVVCLELHTYSSLSPSFLPQYRGSLKEADEAAVYVDPAAGDLKRHARLSLEEIVSGFQWKGLKVLQSSQELEAWITSLELDESDLHFMSSGNFGGLDLPGLFGERIRG